MVHLFDECVLRGFRSFSWRLAVASGSGDGWRARPLTLACRNYPPQIPSGGYLAHGIQIYEARVTAGRGGQMEAGGSEGDGGIQ